MAEQQYPEPTVGALIFNPEGNVFLMKSRKFQDQWVPPGGHIELGESMEDALKREVREETGLRIHSLEFICFHEMIFDPTSYPEKHLIFFDYACRTKDREVTLNDEGQEYHWFALKDALALQKLEPYTRKTIEIYLQNKLRE